jgi:hypothetical protein
MPKAYSVDIKSMRIVTGPFDSAFAFMAFAWSIAQSVNVIANDVCNQIEQ